MQFSNDPISPLSRFLPTKTMSGTCSTPKHLCLSPLLSLNLNIFTMFLKFTDKSGDTHECLGVEHVPDIVLVGRNRKSGDIGSL